MPTVAVTRQSLLYAALLMLALHASQAACAQATLGQFTIGRDLFLAQFDSKTDVDDLHSVAGVATMLRSPAFAGVDYHAVAGAYGIQEGLYVPAPRLFDLAFGSHWSDAHEHREQALEEVAIRVASTLASGGHVWVAEAGQSDFTADWLRRVRAMDIPVSIAEHVHVVQHSEWNESVTSADKLSFVREFADYRKIPDGNVAGNGTPGLRTEYTGLWDAVLAAPRVAEPWRLAKAGAMQFNGFEGRYDNAAIAAGGMDFSDVAETCWIFGYADIPDAEAFFSTFLQPLVGQ